MDVYLASLVRKGEEPVYEPEEVVPASEDFEPLPDEADAVDEVIEEVPAEAVEEKIEEPEKEESEPEEVVEEPVEIKAEEPTQGGKSEVKEGDIISVKNIRVYKTPDIHQVAKNITGNVTYIGKIGNFTAISYVRSGFGVVKGFTPDL